MRVTEHSLVICPYEELRRMFLRRFRVIGSLFAPGPGTHSEMCLQGTHRGSVWCLTFSSPIASITGVADLSISIIPFRFQIMHISWIALCVITESSLSGERKRITALKGECLQHVPLAPAASSSGSCPAPSSLPRVKVDLTLREFSDTPIKDCSSSPAPRESQA